MSVCLSMSTVASSSRSSSTSVRFFQNPRATAKNSPFLLRATKKKPSPFIPSTTQPLNQTKKPHFENLRIRAAADGVSAVDEAQEDWASTASQDESEYAQDESEYDESEYAQDESEYEETEKLGVFVGQKDKPRLVLKFIWLEKNIGLALNQVIPGYGTIPLSPYYFWPRKDAWEELKTTLESKPWISQKRMIILLNQATDIINLWQQSGGNL